MATPSSREILERQALLIAQAETQRERVAAALDRLQPYASLGDRAIDLARTLAAHPEWVAIGVAGVAILKPRFLWRMSGRLWFVWRAYRSLRGLLQEAVARVP